eukprot:Lankesteria_metandrocarpae@DN4484_c1_g1_i2.p1
MSSHRVIDDDFESLGEFIAMRTNSSCRLPTPPNVVGYASAPTVNGLHPNPKVAEYVQYEESSILKDSQGVIERQRVAIKTLRDCVERMETQRAELNIRHSDEVRLYADENQRLRLQMDGLKAEVAALSESQIAQDETVRRFTDHLRTAEGAIVERDSLLASANVSLGRLPFENQTLREDYTRLQANFEKLKRQVDTNTVGSWQEEYEQSQRDVDRLTLQLNAAEGHRAELGATRKALLQLEAEIADYQIVTEKQRVEIERLYAVIVAMDKEKSLMPPAVVLAGPATGIDGADGAVIREKLLCLKTAEETESEFNRLVQRIEQVVENKFTGHAAVQ